ncbi:cupin-like domain-containing protein [Fimicolochytrium jonesii]|uniref:cupin-like domain-containing protein n=1 Tax=Fimicolochytrium jonesii TaxID=1396493 RepID=UPI0022FF096D|nr:cupin-like domain-containing protein [Fimicolochytrium jonesii]KAI8827155.1 cupin-like domain-containing protein [Fimicolochytrium jonesii]
MLPEVTSQTILDVLISQAREARTFRSSHVSRLPAPPTALEFSRLVRDNFPVVIEHVADSWPAMERWRSKMYLEQKVTKPVTVAVTPNGLADAVVEGHFVLPHEQKLSFADLLSHFPPKSATTLSAEEEMDSSQWRSGDPAPPTYYCQSQNNNMHDEFTELLEDIPPDITWASDAFGKPPDAVNFWMGGRKSVTALHKDHYENLYVVVAGTKTFILIPPQEQFCLYERLFPTATYHPTRTSFTEPPTWTILPTSPQTSTPWIPVNPLHPSPTDHPLYTQHCRPLIVTVHAGETLYLPSLWYHQVLQEEEGLDRFRAVVAVNYWYDMSFGGAWAAGRVVGRLGRVVTGVEEWEEGEDGEEE